jgi:hypothetical protein
MTVEVPTASIERHNHLSERRAAIHAVEAAASERPVTMSQVSQR